MRKAIVSTKKTVFIDPLPVVPETRVIDPLVQCGVLYLGTSPTTNSRRGLDAIQEPFSYQYPVDGTNTARGIDGVLSVYDNGIQLTFTRQSEAAVFFPITSLLYCASLRFSVIKNDRTKPKTNVHWRFMPLDTASSKGENKHPPLFCAVFHRTQILPGDECHCFITKTSESALALIQTVSRVYKNMQSDFKTGKNPIFYELDHLGRKTNEISDTIYLSPANDEDGQLNRTNPIRLKDETVARKYLLNPSYGGYYYRTDSSLIEQWQLWDDDDLTGCRPHPPDSPFGLHEGLYHDDTTQEIQRCLRKMENEEHASSCSCSSEWSCSSSSISTEYSRRKNLQHRTNRQSSPTDTDHFDESFAQLVASTFEPNPPKKSSKIKKNERKPIIIEKVLPKAVPSKSSTNKNIAEHKLDPSNLQSKSDLDYISSSDRATFSYQINEYGEKITKEGNRIIFMDVVQPNQKTKFTDPPSYIPVKSSPSRRRRRSKRHIPIIDIQQLDKLISEQKLKLQRRTSLPSDTISNKDFDHENYVTTSDLLGILHKYFGYDFDNKIKSNNQDMQTTLDYIDVPDQKEQKRKNSSMSSTDSSKSERRQRRSRSTTTNPSIHSEKERPSIPSSVHSHMSVGSKQKSSPVPSVLNDKKLDRYISNIYGTAGSINSVTSSSHHHENESINQTALLNAGYTSTFPYMQSKLYTNYLQEYHHAY
ncbi:hypothetical protein I4U23_008443 [Adineta vaga]|nr:hypothetical protein I4U23_008443 [Adineta vaga]